MWSMAGEHCPLQWGTAPVRVLASHDSIAATRKHDFLMSLVTDADWRTSIKINQIKLLARISARAMR